SHNAAYRHFADRDALMRALAARALTIWAGVVCRRVAEVGARRGKQAAWDRISAAGRAYVEFAVTSPGLFALACAPALGSVEPDEPVAHPYAQLSACLDELVTVKAITPQRRTNAEIAAWSAVHGFAMLVLDGPLRDLPEAERARLLEEVLRVVREGI
ncbi:MAG: TetR-like C-terminal domain-containing protein, partial [Mycobacteriales bacterium]